MTEDVPAKQSVPGGFAVADLGGIHPLVRRHGFT